MSESPNMSESPKMPDHETPEQSRLYRQLRERNARQQRRRAEKMQRLAEQNAHRGPLSYRHPSR
jgi:hypothetical protein